MDVIVSLVDRGFNHSHPLAAQLDDGGGQSHGHVAEEQNMVTAYIALQLAGQISLPILIATLLFHKRIARRNPTVINLCIVWTLTTIPAELLFYTGKYKQDGPRPSSMLCLFQAATVSANLPMAAMAYFSVVVHACTVIREIMNANTVRPFTLDVRMIILLSSPYISFLAFSLYIAIIGAQNPQDVKADLFFCEVKNHSISIPIFTFTATIVLLTLLAQVWIGVMFYRNRLAKRNRKSGRSYTAGALRDISGIDVQLLIRMVAFTAFEVVIAVSSIALMFRPRMGAAKVLIATPPFAVFLIFASSQDIFHAWFPCFFRRRSVSQSFEPLVGPGSALPARVEPKSSLDTLSPPNPTLKPAPVVQVRTSSVWTARDQDVDLEKGFRSSAPLSLHIPQPQVEEISTTAVVQGPNSSPLSPMETIRAFRTMATTPKPKSRFPQI